MVKTLALIFLGLAALLPASAGASGIQEFEAQPSSDQAGGHPDLTVRLKVDYNGDPPQAGNCACNNARNLDVELPAGFVGNPHATPQCSAADFARETCPADSQIGVAKPIVGFGSQTLEISPTPIYNLVPPPTEPGVLAWQIRGFGAPIYSVIAARTEGDYGLNIFTDGIEQAFPLSEYTTQLWGVPADSSHDGERFSPGPSNSPRTPFLQNPVTCAGPLTSTLTVRGYDEEVHQASAPWPATAGCDQLSFNPSLSAQPTTTETDAPSGLEVDLKVPQESSPDTPSPSEIRAATVQLPVGFSLNPNAADGKTSCDDSEARFGTEDEAQCPEFAKVGTVTLDSSALPAPIPGAVYIGKPLPGERYRLFLTADGFGTHIKLAGSLSLDPATGQVTVSFQNLPQSPLTEFNLHFFGSERGVLATPTQCGTYAVHSSFTPWDAELAAQSATQFFSIDSGSSGAPCPPAIRPFTPGFSASSVGNVAGAHSPFSIRLTRNDGDQDLSGLTVTTPPGFTATLAGIPYCPDTGLAQVAASGYSGLGEQVSPICPQASQVGTSDVAAGSGSHPVYLPGRVYLAGPYKGAPLSLAVITPGVSGPFDLGNVVVRVALEINPLTAQVSAVSDPLPLIYEGIPLRLRTLQVDLDRPGFTLDPTDCDPFAVEADVLGDQGTSAARSSHFQMANCATLPFAPRLNIRLSGGLNRLGHPAIHTTLTAQPGEANLRRVSVTLPKGELLDQSHIGGVCTRLAFAANACPASSRVGSARIATPLLDQPLTGYVYLRSSNSGLPDLALDLEGQVDIEAVGRVDSVNQRYRATFAAVPDVPISEIALDLAGGSKGLLQNSKSLCGTNDNAMTQLTGQNGAVLNRKAKLQLTCGQAHRKRPRRHTRKAG